MRLRLIFGSMLALAVIGLISLDGYLAWKPAPRLLLGPIDLGPWLSNGLLCTLVVLTLTMMATRELTQFAQILGMRPLRGETYLFAGGMVVGSYISFNLQTTADWYDESWGVFWLAIALAYSFWSQAARRGTEHAFGNLSATLFIILYAGGLAGYMTKLRMEVGGHEGAFVLLFAMFIVKITDVGAFFTGSLIGRTKLIPWLSPRKTWEGLMGGVATAIACAILVGRQLDAAGLIELKGPYATVWGLAAFGAILAVFSVAGDLCASLLKRDAAVKDSSNVIPGMGGVLDVLDSPLLAAPAAWFLLTRV